MLKISDIVTYQADATTKCVHWTGKTHKKKPVLYKYGRVWYVRSEVYKLRKGLIPKGFYIQMACGNWDCINSSHMQLYSNLGPRFGETIGKTTQNEGRDNV